MTVFDSSEVTMKGNTTFLVEDIAKLIDEARYHVACEYTSTQVLLCWLIGKRINEEILKTERAEYGEEIVTLLAENLALAFTYSLKIKRYLNFVNHHEFSCFIALFGLDSPSRAIKHGLFYETDR